MPMPGLPFEIRGGRTGQAQTRRASWLVRVIDTWSSSRRWNTYDSAEQDMAKSASLPQTADAVWQTALAGSLIDASGR